MKDLHNRIKVLADKVARVADNTAQVVGGDRSGFEAVEFIVAAGTLADDDATFAVLVEDSDDNGIWGAVDDAYLLGTEAGAAFVFSDDNKVQKIGYVGGKKYARITVTPSGNTGNADLCILMIGGFPLMMPQSAQEV